ncbi:hypothetical protein C8F01DRAFT_1247232 [Mycena amicta]|nr:hypothetical protein C8F01DRAFT_1247232 [Mycena amicta]
MSDKSAPDHLSASSFSSTPSFVHRIDLETIAAVATAALWFIDFVDGAQWVLRTPIAEWNIALEKCMRSDIIGMQLIQSRTSIPIPHIHEFSIPAKLWFDPAWAREERCKTIFRSLVSFMSQLQVFEFPTIGSLDFDPSTLSHVVVPLLPSSDDLEDEDMTARGPYNTVHAYLLDGIARQTTSAPSKDQKTSLLLLLLFAGALPDHALDGPPFVLSMPDFNYQNVFVNDDGQVAGLIDWDDMMVGPRQGGYAKYPSDGETSESSEDESYKGEASEKNQISSREELQEDSPSTLQMFRDDDLAIFKEVDSTSARYTRNSHVEPILERLTRHVFANEVEFGAWSLEKGILAGDGVKALE